MFAPRELTHIISQERVSWLKKRLDDSVTGPALGPYRRMTLHATKFLKHPGWCSEDIQELENALPSTASIQNSTESPGKAEDRRGVLVLPPDAGTMISVV